MPIEKAYDQYGHEISTITPRGVALTRKVQALTTSFKIQLNESTEYLRVYAISKDVYLKWASSDVDYVTSSNFDEVIPAGQMVDFMVPIQSSGARFELIQLVGRESGATAIVIEK